MERVERPRVRVRRVRRVRKRVPAAYRDREGAGSRRRATEKKPKAAGSGQDVGVEALDAFFARTPRLAVAFSGGCDSSFLLAAALRAGCDVKAYGVRTAFQPAFEIDDAKRLAAELGADFELVDADVLAQGEICANGPDRCYRCKTFIFSTILARMAEDGFEVLADGTNVTDDPANRPGFQALAELGVVSPLRHLGRRERRAARRVAQGCSADKPSFSCIAVHVGAGHPSAPGAC